VTKSTRIRVLFGSVSGKGKANQSVKLMAKNLHGLVDKAVDGWAGRRHVSTLSLLPPHVAIILT
jgi:hypothetical protein